MKSERVKSISAGDLSEGILNLVLAARELRIGSGNAGIEMDIGLRCYRSAARLQIALDRIGVEVKIDEPQALNITDTELTT